jgi:exportin-2 (importin alpha re-exporter)
LPELQGATKSEVLRATCIKFITTFRQMLPKELYALALPHLVALMRDPNYVIHSYAATCVERLLTVKDAGVLRIGPIAEAIGPMLTNLFEALNYKESQENEYIMRAITRVISVAGPNIVPFADICLRKLLEILIRVSQNSTNPTFAHYVFESLGSLVKNTCVQNSPAVNNFENALFPTFSTILQKDIDELTQLAKTKRLSELAELEGAQPTPYILQILSLLLELSPVPISPLYADLFPRLLLVVMWERKSNVPALIRIVQAYLRKGPQIVVAGNHLVSILGIFQNKFNKSKVHDHEGFYLLESIVENLAIADFEKFLPQIFQEIFGRLGQEKTKTLKYVKSFLVFLSLFIGKHGPTAVISRVDAIQPNIFAMILDSLYIPNVGKVNGKIERKICCVAMIKLLTESPELLSTYAAFWPKIMAALLGVIELPEDDTVQHGEFAEEDDEIDHAFSSAAFSPLSFAAKSDVDPFPGVNPKAYLATQFQTLLQAQPQVQPLVAALEPNALEALRQYYQLAGIKAPF